MNTTPMISNWRRFLGAAIVSVAVAALANGPGVRADVPRAQQDAGVPAETPEMDAGTVEMDAGVPEMQGTLKSSMLRSSMNVPE